MTVPENQVRMPAVFLAHGSPMNAVEHNDYTEAWSAFGKSLQKPTAVLAISAHWYVNKLAVTAMKKPRTIHDFSGFPPALSTFEYPADGSPTLAARVAELLSPREVVLDESEWGLDHGTWSLLCHVFPEADVPVVQLSIDRTLDPMEHVAIGRALAPLRDEGVLVVGSGNIVHNLGLIDWSARGTGADWAQHFDSQTREILTGNNPCRVIEMLDQADARKAVPTPEHFLPIAYIAGLADVAKTSLEAITHGCEMGSLSMSSYVLRD